MSGLVTINGHLVPDWLQTTLNRASGDGVSVPTWFDPNQAAFQDDWWNATEPLPSTVNIKYAVAGTVTSKDPAVIARLLGDAGVLST